jgi:hypothetical protein
VDEVVAAVAVEDLVVVVVVVVDPGVDVGVAVIGMQEAATTVVDGEVSMLEVAVYYKACCVI